MLRSVWLFAGRLFVDGPSACGPSVDVADGLFVGRLCVDWSLD